ncbi:MAG: MG2 domain-containing protein [Flavobacteriales bacterium]|jgi:uncharacterized protein YfaS (alpha-2-macroglobulin family)|nr:MG2 domain-containing protein [Flavobacteriales bacterium]
MFIKKKSLAILLISFLFVNIFHSCKKKETAQEIQSNYHLEYFSGDGLSVHEPFLAQFDFEILQDTLSKIDLLDHCQIKPKIAGKWYFSDSKTIAFKPETHFDFAKQYEVKIKLKGLHSQFGNNQKDFETSFKTRELSFRVNYKETQSYNKKYQYVLGKVEFSDAVKNSEAQKIIEAQIENQSIAIKWIGHKDLSNKYHEFKLDSLTRTDADQKVKISWDGNAINVEEKGNLEVVIFAKNVFKAVSARIENKESNAILVNFSEKLKKNQNLSGLIKLGRIKFTTKTEGNNLFIYPKGLISNNIHLTINKNIKNIDGVALKKTFKQTIQFNPEQPQIRIKNNGNILTSINQSMIYFEAISLKKVDIQIIKIPNENMLQFFQDNSYAGTSRIKYVGNPVVKKTIDISTNNFTWTTHAIDLNKMTRLDENALYRVEFFIRPEYNQICDIEAKDFKTRFDQEDYNSPTESSHWDMYDDYYYAHYKWRERNDPCKLSYYLKRRNALTSKNIYKSDIGITAKKGTNDLKVVLLNIIDNSAIGNAEVKIYNFQKKLIAISRTDANGIARFDEIKSHISFVEAISGHDKNYLRLMDGRSLSLSRFDVGGMSEKGNLKGFIYLNRGVRRPGDKIEVNFVLQENKNDLPKGTPITFEFYDPKGKLISRKTQGKLATNHYHQTFSTNIEDITGNWMVKTTVGNAVFSKNVKVETIKPNRLKIALDLPKKLNSDDQNKTINGQVKWLHGAIANNLQVHSELTFSRKKLNIKGFNAYHFENEYRTFNARKYPIFQGKSGNDGKFAFTLNLKNHYNFPGMMRGHLSSRAYEKGGDFSMSMSSFDYSPFKQYVGILIPKGDKSRNMLLTDKKHTLEFALATENGKAVANKNIEIKIYKVNWKWWWEKRADNFVSYASGNALNPKFKKIIKTNSKGIAQMPFEIKYPEWGRYLVVAKDLSAKNGHIATKTLNIDWPGWAGKSKKLDPTFASILNFTTDKEKYQTGETAQLTVPSAEGGKLIVSIEKGKEILDIQMHPTVAGKTQVNIPIRSDFSPNVYLNVSLVYPQENKKSDLPIRLFGVKPISVYNPATALNPVIDMQDEIKPEEEFELEIAEQDGKEMNYTIAVVDDGILDLTNFRTPNPWNHFYSKEALGVKSWDVYDDIIGAYTGKLNQVFAVGGDGSAGAANNKKAKRFKPVSIHLGPFNLKAGEKQKHKIKMPRYIGSVRTMVVATNTAKKAYGKSNKTVTVKKPLMVLSSAPRKFVKGDIFKLPVTVFAMKSSVKKVKVSLKTNDFIEIVGESSKTIKFSKEGDQIVEFDCKVKSKTGNAKIEIFAKSGRHKAQEKISIYTDNPNKKLVKTSSITLAANESKEIPIEYFGEDGTNRVGLEFSSIPPLNLGKRLDYLIRYPYGCLEQTTSNSFPQLFLEHIKELTNGQKVNIQNHMKKAINKIARMQKDNGSLGYWSSNSYYNTWSNIYAGHFMLTAEKKGYQLPYSFRDKYLSFLYNTISNKEDIRLSKAYALYVLAFADKPNVSAMNKMREQNHFNDLSLAWLALAYQEIGQEKIAKSILSRVQISDWNSYSTHTYGSSLRNKAILLLANKKLKNNSQATSLAKEISDQLVSNKWYSTQTTAFSLMALAEFASAENSSMKFEYRLDGNPLATVNTKTKIYSVDSKNAKKVTLKNLNNGPLYIQKKLEGIPVLGNEIALSNKLSINTYPLDENNKVIDLTKVKQGTTFSFKIIVKNNDKNKVENIALTQLFPSGWEILPSYKINSFFDGQADFVDTRDDRVNAFFSLKAGQSKTFKIRLNASYKGTYYFSGTHAEAMYDNSYSAKKKGYFVSVIGNE